VEHELIMKYHLLSSKIKQVLLPDLSKYFTFFKQDMFRKMHELQPLEMCVISTHLDCDFKWPSTVEVSISAR
jgi:hypothetical protein